MPGEIRAIIGPNGAGKTTFVSLICGRIEPSAGVDRLRRRGHHPPAGLQARAARHRLYVPDHQRLRQPVGLRQCRAAGARAHDRRARPRRACWRRRHGGAGAAPGWRPRRHAGGTLAYGHQRLLEVAMGLALKPRLLILDEPTQGLSDGEIENFIGAGARDPAKADRAADRAQHGGGDGAGRPHHRADAGQGAGRGHAGCRSAPTAVQAPIWGRRR
jgi:branched-chain amino acid transport system ATP-binding protein